MLNIWCLLLITILELQVIAYGGNKTLRIGYLVPYTGSWPVGPYTASAIINGIQEIRNRNLLDEYDIEWIWRDTQCNPRLSMKQAVRMHYDFNYDVIIGEGCSAACQASALIAATWSVPYVGVRCFSSILSDKNTYPTFTRPVSTDKAMGPIYAGLAEAMNWTKIAIIRDDSDVYRLMGDSTLQYMQHANRTVYLRSILPVFNSKGLIEEKNYDHLKKVILEMKGKVRALYIFTYSVDFRAALIIAHENGMLFGQYAFVGSAFGTTLQATYTYKPEYGVEIYNGVFHREMWIPDGPIWDNFVMQVIKNFNDPHFDNYDHMQLNDDPQLVNFYAGVINDAVLMWGYGVNKTIQDGDSPRDGMAVTKNLYNLTFEGITGKVIIDAVGDRVPNYKIDIVQNGKLVLLFKLLAEDMTVQKVYKPNNATDFTGLVWPGMSTVPPLGPLPCSETFDSCQKNNGENTNLEVVIATSVLITFGLMCTVLALQKLRSKSMLRSMKSHCISWHNVTPIVNNVDERSSSRHSNSRVNDRFYTETVLYNNAIAAVKRIDGNTLHISGELLLEIKCMKELQHENVNSFIALCTEAPNVCILMLYGNRGSIHDVISGRRFNMAADIKVSLSNDIASDSFGRLTSRNCIVDERWVCKITDFGFTHLRRRAIEHDSLDIEPRTLLWTAPELLRMTNIPFSGSETGDVYSYGIILCEIWNEAEPFAGNEPPLSHQEIVHHVKLGGGYPYRPHIELDMVTEHWVTLMISCWHEMPACRPTFSTILKIIKDLNGGKNLSLIDSMIQRLENYTKNLENIVDERTKEVTEEKAKSETLLLELLPQSVVDAKKSSHEVTPELFDDVTVYFSDIVGFTRISAAGTPLDVVRMLNLVYTVFDDVCNRFDVYKVATIGDAYFVASGVPIRNGKRHAVEICSMALELLDAVGNLHIPHIPEEQLRLRSGVHTGPCVAGIVGLKMPRYLLFGEAVDIASKLESTGMAMSIQISTTAYDVIKTCAQFCTEYRGSVSVGPTGLMDTYWLTKKTKAKEKH